ncbi:MAG TPA: hypothetical protein VGA20_02565 [Gemmatimonadales bacterium]
MGGYQRLHERPPAFGGSDGRAYTVAPYVAEEPEGSGRYAAALLFVAWAEGAERPSGHLETDYLAFGATAEESLAPLLALTLHEVKAHLDRCIAVAQRATLKDVARHVPRGGG